MTDWIDERGLAYDVVKSGYGVQGWSDFAWQDEPRVLAVLKAAAAAVEWSPYGGQNMHGATVCGFCGAETLLRPESEIEHRTACPWQLLVAAVRGGS